MRSRDADVEAFGAFAREVEPRLRYALVAACGYQRGREAAQDALVYAWEHWDKVRATKNPAGYIYRVAKRRASRLPRTLPLLRDPPIDATPNVEPGLKPALDHLSRMQRSVVLLVAGLGLTHRETAQLLGIHRSTVQTHLERGMHSLRAELGVQLDA